MKCPLRIVGLGENNATFNVYMANRPPIEPYISLASLQSLEPGDIECITTTTGNHWRKVFNVFAKILFQLHPQNFKTWQHYRDGLLLQQGSSQALWFVNKEQLFQPVAVPQWQQSDTVKSSAVHIIMGKTFASSIFSENELAEEFVWVNESFAINREQKIIICPYFDYRQLSNLKITQLVKLIKSLLKN